jgi:opacity protein-like surface antigen
MINISQRIILLALTAMATMATMATMASASDNQMWNQQEQAFSVSLTTSIGFAQTTDIGYESTDFNSWLPIGTEFLQGDISGGRLSTATFALTFSDNGWTIGLAVDFVSGGNINTCRRLQSSDQEVHFGCSSQGFELLVPTLIAEKSFRVKHRMTPFFGFGFGYAFSDALDQAGNGGLVVRLNGGIDYMLTKHLAWRSELIIGYSLGDDENQDYLGIDGDYEDTSVTGYGYASLSTGLRFFF